MRSLLIATCLTALGGFPKAFASEMGVKPQAATSHDAKKADGVKAVDPMKPSETAKTSDGKKDPAKSAEAATPGSRPVEHVASGGKGEAEKTPSTKAGEGNQASGKSADPKGGEAVTASETAKPEEVRAATIVEMKTSEGTIRLELADRDAPVTVKNFLSYVQDKFYDGTIFHRVIDDFMIQGGGYVVEGEKLIEKTTKAPIINEAKNGLKNNRGTIAMARMKDPNSATAQFYINQVNNNNLDYPSFDGHGYAVFGKVIDGIDVVDKIAKVKTGVKGGMPDVPLTDVKIIAIQVVHATGH